MKNRKEQLRLFLDLISHLAPEISAFKCKWHKKFAHYPRNFGKILAKLS